jgi:protein RecA
VAKRKRRAKGRSLDEIRAELRSASLTRAREVERLPTRFLRLDAALGGGLERGAIYEIYGPPDSYKSTTVLSLMADVQRRDPRLAVYANFEYTFDPAYARRCGVVLTDDRWQEILPPSLEKGIDACNDMLETGGVGVLAVDSIAALAPDAELGEARAEDAQVAVGARGISRWLRRLKPAAARHGAVVLLVNQTRAKIGVFFGSKTTTPGGKAPKYYSSVRLLMWSRKGREGYRDVTFRIEKNKQSGVRGDFVYRGTERDGFQLRRELLELALMAGLARHDPRSGLYVLRDRRMTEEQAVKALARSRAKIVRAAASCV